MGTRADFYVGRGTDAEWLGSIAWDGYPEGIESKILRTRYQKAYREYVQEYIESREDGTLPEMGWPWPWDDSGTTDFAYAFDNGRVYVCCFGSAWTDTPLVEDVFDQHAEDRASFPDMSGQKHSAAAGSKRSGVMVVSAPMLEGKEAKGK